MVKTIDEKLWQGIVQHIQEISGHNDCEILNIEPGYARLTIVVSSQSLNLYGNAHGGFLFSLCDIAAGMATYAYGYSNVTLQANINYVSKVQESERIFIECTTSHKGRTTAINDVQIHNEAGKLVTSATFTMFIMDEIQ